MKTSPSGSRLGRPRKFDGPSSVVTVTLPDRTLRDLERIDRDRARAIVKAVQNATPSDSSPTSFDVDVVEMVPGTGLIVIGPSEVLKSIPFLHLVEIAPRRFLLAMDSGHDFKGLEVAIRDLLEDGNIDDEREQGLLQRLLDQIRSERRSKRVRMAEILFVRLQK